MFKKIICIVLAIMCFSINAYASKIFLDPNKWESVGTDGNNWVHCYEKNTVEKDPYEGYTKCWYLQYRDNEDRIYLSHIKCNYKRRLAIFYNVYVYRISDGAQIGMQEDPDGRVLSVVPGTALDAIYEAVR